MKSIRQERIRARLKFLASSHFKGRATGSPEAELTAAYIASVFEAAGLLPAPHFTDYIHSFGISRALPRYSGRLEFRNTDGSVVSFESGDDYLPASWGPDASVQGKQAVFVGYGLAAPALDYDDFQGVDLGDKVAIMLSGGPPDIAFRRVGSTDVSDPVEKSLQAAARGACGVVLIQSAGKELPSPGSDFGHARAHLSGRLDSVSVPVVRMTFAAGESLLRHAAAPETPSRPLETLQGRIDRTAQAQSFSLQGRIDMQVSYRRRKLQGYNVIGHVPGSDSVLKDEFIILGAHHDHMGVDEKGRIFLGADDNASGTTALLELAEAFQSNPTKPRRSILLAAWGAEEIGLLGSRNYVRAPPVPLQKTVAMFQMDMIGRNAQHRANLVGELPGQSEEDNRNSLNIFGASVAPMLRDFIERSNARTGLDLRFPAEPESMDLLRRSDHWPFLKRGIPALFLFAGFHPDYHRPTDTADKIHFSKLENIVKLVYLAVWEVGEARRRPQLDPGVFGRLTHRGPAGE
ncbi:MAG: M20/M25/M40 family metallo-hydrolase [Acidobacteria bacterium]|nr:M20/M25/M40 family metallo-hydrolase [Acidobacteriota bacterium]